MSTSVTKSTGRCRRGAQDRPLRTGLGSPALGPLLSGHPSALSRRRSGAVSGCRRRLGCSPELTDVQVACGRSWGAVALLTLPGCRWVVEARGTVRPEVLLGLEEDRHDQPRHLPLVRNLAPPTAVICAICAGEEWASVNTTPSTPRLLRMSAPSSDLTYRQDGVEYGYSCTPLPAAAPCTHDRCLSSTGTTTPLVAPNAPGCGPRPRDPTVPLGDCVARGGLDFPLRPVAMGRARRTGADRRGQPRSHGSGSGAVDLRTDRGSSRGSLPRPLDGDRTSAGGPPGIRIADACAVRLGAQARPATRVRPLQRELLKPPGVDRAALPSGVRSVRGAVCAHHPKHVGTWRLSGPPSRPVVPRGCAAGRPPRGQLSVGAGARVRRGAGPGAGSGPARAEPEDGATYRLFGRFGSFPGRGSRRAGLWVSVSTVGPLAGGLASGAAW